MIEKIKTYLTEHPKRAEELDFMFGVLTVVFGLTTINVITIYTPIKAIIRSIIFCVSLISMRVLDSVVTENKNTK